MDPINPAIKATLKREFMAIAPKISKNSDIISFPKILPDFLICHIRSYFTQDGCYF